MTKEYHLILTQIPRTAETDAKLIYNLMLSLEQTDAVVITLIDNDYTPELEKELDAMTEIFKERHDNVYFISATGNAKEIIENDELFDELVQTIKDSKDIPLDDYDLDEAYTIGFDD